MEGPPLWGFSLAVGCCRIPMPIILFSLSCNHETLSCWIVHRVWGLRGLFAVREERRKRATPRWVNLLLSVRNRGGNNETRLERATGSNFFFSLHFFYSRLLEAIFVHFWWRVIHVSLSDGARSWREWRVDSERYVVTSLSAGSKDERNE